VEKKQTVCNAPRREKANVISELKMRTDQIEKEIAAADKWFENWSDVYFPGKNMEKLDVRLNCLEQKAREAKQREMEIIEARKKIRIDTSLSSFRVRASGLQPSYPFG